MRRSCRCGGMVFQMLPGARSVMPISSRQEGDTSGWMYMRKVPLVGAPFLAEFAAVLLPALVMSRCGMSAPAGTEFM